MIGETSKELAAKKDPAKKYDLLVAGYYTYRVYDYEYGVSLTKVLPWYEAKNFLAELQRENGYARD